MDQTTLPLNEKLLNLEELVQEKDQLLSILTERLEQAVEQLDRFRREGTHADYEAPAVVPGPLESEPDLRDDLRQMLTDWQDLQQRGWFDQLDQRLDTIHDCLSRSDSTQGSRSQPQSAVPETQPKTAPKPKEDSETYTSSVADILSRFGIESSKEPEPPAKQAVAVSVPASSGNYGESGEARSDWETLSESMLVPLPAPPEPVDLDTEDVSVLRSALDARDTYITLLHEYLHAMNDTAQEPVQFPTLESLTGDQRNVLADWSNSIRKEFRQTQIEISLERAQLSRETMKLQHQQQQIDSELKRLKLAKRVGTTEVEVEPADEAKPRSWRGLFGGK